MHARLFEPIIIKSAHALSLISGEKPGAEIAPGVYQPGKAKALVSNFITREFNARLTHYIAGMLATNHEELRAIVHSTLSEALSNVMAREPHLLYQSRFECNEVNNNPERFASGRVYVDWLLQLPHSVSSTRMEFHSWASQREADEQWVALGNTE